MNLKNGKIIYVSTDWLYKQNIKNWFSADIFIRYNTIDGYLNSDEKVWDIYNTMQNTRVASNKKIPQNMINHEKEFIKLIESFQNNGYLDKYPMKVNKNFITVDGSHRLSCALYFGIDKVPITSDEFHYGIEPSPYDLNWFKENNLVEYINIIENRKKEIDKRLKRK